MTARHVVEQAIDEHMDGTPLEDPMRARIRQPWLSARSAEPRVGRREQLNSRQPTESHREESSPSALALLDSLSRVHRRAVLIRNQHLLGVWRMNVVQIVHEVATRYKPAIYATYMMAKTPSTIAITVIGLVRFTGPKKTSIPIANFSVAAAIKIGVRVPGAYAL